MSQKIILTEKEREILLLMMEDKTPKEVAAKLGKSLRTVEKQTQSARHRCGFKTVVGLMAAAVRGGVVEI